MIQSKKDLREYIASDNQLYRPWTVKQKIVSALVQDPTYALRRYLRFLRMQEYYVNTAKGSKKVAISSAASTPPSIAA